jgi:selenocysteine lyase/cysteine desulfurase
VIDEQFPSNYYSWKKLADRYKATIKTIPHPKDNVHSVKQWNADILNAINNNTAFVAMGNIHWSNGCLFNLKAIREKTRRHNALLISDGSQTVGAFPFSVKEIQPDAMVCAGYKWLFGPYGCAYAYFGKAFDNGDAIEENWANRLDSENFAGLTNYQPEYKPLANRYTVGESGNFIYVKMQIAALKQVLDWTPEAIQDYCKHISKDAVKELQALGCTIVDRAYRTHHLFGVELPDNLDLNTLKTVLTEQNVHVSFRGHFVRISCHLYNTKEDFDALVNCFKSVLQNT